MDWAKIYRDTASHMLPKAEPYAGVLRDFILANRLPMTTWIAEALAMLEGFGQANNPRDLAMLASMLERSSLAVLPAVALSGLVEQAIGINRRDLAIRSMTFDGLRRIMPLQGDDAARLSRDIAAKVVSDVVRGTDILVTTAANASRDRGSRIDVTGHAHQARIAPVCEMATSIVVDFLPIDRLSRDMVERLAA